MATSFYRGTESIQAHLEAVHGTVKQAHPSLERIAVAIFDPKTKYLRTFTHSSGGMTPLEHYEFPLSSSKSLSELSQLGNHRVIDDLNTLPAGQGAHSARIAGQYKSSLTVPFYSGKSFAGFIFFNASVPHFFEDDRVKALTLVAELICSLVLEALRPIEMLSNTIRVAKDVSHYRDEETGAHLDRVAGYSRLIAAALADDYGLDDSFVELVYLFAPLHDLGKVSIPDHILLKPGRLDEAEMGIMRTHAQKGVTICDRILNNLDSVAVKDISILRNIVRGHHEAWDGSGYPKGLVGRDIPLEAAIVSVADVFDALTSSRPYKKAWPTGKAFEFLQENAGVKFHPDCVSAFLERKETVLDIKRRFQDEEEEDDTATIRAFPSGGKKQMTG